MRAPSLPRVLGVLLAALAVAGAASVGCSGSDGATAANAAGGASPAGPAACDTCHMGDFRDARGHVGQRPTQCAVCHTPAAWHPTGLHHDFWPLTGKHEKTPCFDCHVGRPPEFRGTDKACVACHRREYDRAPGHAGHFPTTCEECHSTAAWKPQLPEHAQPPGTPSEPSTPGGVPATTSTASGRKPAPNPPKPSPRPGPPKPTPSVEPTSNASKRL